MPDVLVTGFGPFEGVEENPSAVLAEMSGGPYAVIDVSYHAADQLISEAAGSNFEYVLMLGVARGRSQVSIELNVHNLRAGTDVAGVAHDGVIDELGPPVLKSTLWTASMIEYLKIQHPDEVALSVDAGTYLCNYLYYQGLRKLERSRIGFLHVVMPEVVPIQTQHEMIKEILSELER